MPVITLSLLPPLIQEERQETMSTNTLPIIGVELGSRMENTALSVTERTYVLASPAERFNASYYDHAVRRERMQAREKVAIEYRVRHLERHSPPVRYKGIAERVVELVEAVGECVIATDITRTGRPVHNLIRHAIDEATRGKGPMPSHVKHCLITVTGIAGGVSRSPDAGMLVPRRDLVSAALLLFEQEQLKIAEGLDLARTLTAEFTDFKPKADPKDDLEGWRLAKNDDLVLAVAISTWAAERFLRKEESVPVGSLEGALGAA